MEDVRRPLGDLLKRAERRGVGGSRSWNDTQGRGARRLTGLSLGGVPVGVSPSRGGRSFAPVMIRQKRGVVRLAESV